MWCGCFTAELHTVNATQVSRAEDLGVYLGQLIEGDMLKVFFFLVFFL